MASRLSRGRNLGLLAVALIALGAGLAVHFANVLSWLDRNTVDARYQLRGSQGPSPGVVVVGIDNQSLRTLPRPPIPRRYHARMIERLHAAGARLIVYDIAFDQATDELDDEALLEAASRDAPVVFATSLISPTGQTQVLGGNASVASMGDRVAASDLPADGDGVLRHTLAQVNGLPTIAAVVSRELQRHPVTAAQLEDGWIDFRGPPGTVRNLAFTDVLSGHFDRAAVRGKVVVVGATAPVLQDVHATAAGSLMSGPEVQANVISTALEGFPLASPSGAVAVLLIAALAALAPAAALRLDTLGVGLTGLAGLILYTLAVQLAFNAGVVLEYAAPVTALAVGTGGSVIRGMWFDRRERRRLRMLFAANEPGAVERVLREPGPRHLGPTSIIAGYRIEAPIASGGMGIVYRATQLALGRTVALKLITPEHAQDPDFRERFKAESRIAASIEHPNVIPVYEAGEDDGLLFISMRFVDGIDLEQVLTNTGPLEPPRAARVIAQVAAALDAAHARGLVHRDVKPANVLLTVEEPEHAYLTDFGVSKRMGAFSRLTNAGQWVGTLDYLAPEQIRGEEVGPAADTYMLAGVLYHCLTGRPPFARENQAATMWAQLSAPVPSPSTLRPELPPGLDEVVARGLAKDPSDRHRSAGELAAACARAVGLEPLPPPPAPPAGGADGTGGAGGTGTAGGTGGAGGTGTGGTGDGGGAARAGAPTIVSE
ncbi:MAG TPA: CHASE2 domain-containing protein [Solirubrobacteraceae bacterium]|nr:CHASE2 domain-containing protein [Solirubrobacteraceae bacterium]